jgi:FG-GAP repeat
MVVNVSKEIMIRLSIFTLACGSAALAHAQDTIFSHVVAKGAETVAAVGDLDADGGADFAVHSAGTGIVIRSGRYGHVLTILPTPAGSDALRLAGAGDVDGDQVPDVAIGDPDLAARVVSGASGVELVAFAHPSPGQTIRFGHRVVRLGDVNGDTVADFVVTAPGETVSSIANSGRARVYSATGALLYTVAPQALGASFGQDATALDDVNLDGFADFAVSSLRDVKVVSGKTGATIRVHTGSLAEQFGHAICGVGDANFDGVPDLAVGAPLAGSTLLGRVSVFSGKTGGPISDFSGGLGHGSRFGFALAPFEPLQNGIARVLVGAPGGASPFGVATGSVIIAEIGLNQGIGAIGAVPGDGTGRAFASVGDANGDGVPEVLSIREVGAGPSNERIVEQLSLATGGAQHLAIDGVTIVDMPWTPVSESAAGRPYVVLGSATGVAPGFQLGVQHHVPLNVDSYFLLTATTLGSNHIVGGIGVLDAEGLAQPSIVIPPLAIPSLVGLVLHHAVIVFDGPGFGGKVRGVSNAAALRLGE